MHDLVKRQDTIKLQNRIEKVLMKAMLTESETLRKIGLVNVTHLPCTLK